jgi:adenine-specific DNA-methyltransferase
MEEEVSRQDMAKLIRNNFSEDANVVLYPGDCLDLLKQIPDNKIQLIVTSPPYNIGKKYEKKTKLEQYLKLQTEVIKECVRVLAPKGNICWEVGNYIEKGEIIPLDLVLYPIFRSLGLKLRNRVIWHFEHGLHCSKRLSGRYESILWFTKSDNYTFNVDPIRVPQKYPGKKYFKGPKKGQLSCNPLGKNPGDVWLIPNVKNNHVEKTAHPCQFPVELIERLVLSMTNKNDWVLDPFMGTGTSAVAALLRGRKSVGAEIMPEYIDLSKSRIRATLNGQAKVRPMNKPIYTPQKPNTDTSLIVNFSSPTNARHKELALA